jgi:hypothetical protein
VAANVVEMQRPPPAFARLATSMPVVGAVIMAIFFAVVIELSSSSKHAVDGMRRMRR